MKKVFIVDCTTITQFKACLKEPVKPLMAKSQSVKNTGMVVSRFLTGGLSSVKQNFCLKERFQISVRHYGIIKTLWFNILIFFRALGFWFSSRFGA